MLSRYLCYNFLPSWLNIYIYHEIMPTYSSTYFQWMVEIVYLFITLCATPFQ